MIGDDTLGMERTASQHILTAKVALHDAVDASTDPAVTERLHAVLAELQAIRDQLDAVPAVV